MLDPFVEESLKRDRSKGNPQKGFLKRDPSKGIPKKGSLFRDPSTGIPQMVLGLKEGHVVDPL